MFALLIRAATLEGAGKGILFFIEPQWGELLNPKASNFIIKNFLIINNLQYYNYLIIGISQQSEISNKTYLLDKA